MSRKRGDDGAPLRKAPRADDDGAQSPQPSPSGPASPSASSSFHLGPPTPLAGAGVAPPSARHSSTPRDTSPPEGNVPRVVRVCVTGGPCAGKSTLLSKLQVEIGPRENIKVFSVPEAATLLVTAGLSWPDMATPEQRYEAQLALIRVQIALEDQLTAIAEATGAQSLVLCDRGVMDGRAYSTPEVFDRIVAALGLRVDDLRQRYDGVIHLVTAADGAESHYTLDNNQARFENVDQAVDVDRRLRNMYLGHPQLKIVDNAGTFQDKINRSIDLVYSFLNRRPPSHRSRRFLLRASPHWASIDKARVKTEIVNTVLVKNSQNHARMVQKRKTEGGQEMYLYHSWQNNLLSSQHRISQMEYELLLQSRDPNKHDVVKENTCFSHEGGFFDVAEVRSPPWNAGKCILYVEGNYKAMPPFLDIVMETTGNHAYSNEGLATRSADGSHHPRPHHEP